MTLDDYVAVYDLWKRCSGIGLGASDTRDAIAGYLERNPGTSPVAVPAAPPSAPDAPPSATAASHPLLGAALCGHDGRRGTLHHVAVDPAHRRRGIARALVDWCIDRLAESGIEKCNIFLWRDNTEGQAFWLREGWSPRQDIILVQRFTRGT
jgi:ribosomal protein S18 acetylase RimI-like enzyme